MGALSVAPPPLGLSLRFADTKSLVDLVSGQNLITFTRASSATYIDIDGAMKVAAVNVPRFDHNPTTGESLGLLIEEQRTNLLLNSATLSTQNVTVTAAAHTLSFTGTGTVTLSGTSTAGPLVGIGTGEANRVSLTFTPTAGTLTLTVSGTVSSAQLEQGSFRTSYIPTTSSAATRAADVASITGANFSNWYNQNEGTLYTSSLMFGIPSSGTDFRRITSLCGTDVNADEISIYRRSPDGLIGGSVTVSPGIIAFDSGFLSAAINTPFKAAIGYKTNDTTFAFNGAVTATDASVVLPTVVSLQIGQSVRYQPMPNAIIRRIDYWPQRLPDSMLRAVTL